MVCGKRCFCAHYAHYWVMVSTHISEPSRLIAPWLVVELGARIGTGMCGTLLADLGADVVLAEPRDLPAEAKWRNRAAVAAGKRSLDHERLRSGGSAAWLLERADVVLLSSDLDAEQADLWDGPRPVHQVICDITAFGHAGAPPAAGLSTALVDAYCGATDTTGEPDGPPVTLGAPLLEMETAVYAASAVIAALRVRRRHGSGQRLDIAVFDVGVNALATFIPAAVTGQSASRVGNRHPGLSPWNRYRAEDGALVICAPTNVLWQRLCVAIASPGLVDDDRFATTSSRLAHADAIDEVIGRWTATRPVDACLATLAEHVIPSGPVVTLDELADEANLTHRTSITTVTDPRAGHEVRVMPSPVRWSDRPSHAVRVPDFDDGGPTPTPVDSRSTPVRGDVVVSHRPLEGVRVLELGMNTVAPLAGRQLAALGADVIKVEPPAGDTNRHSPPLREDGQSHIYAISNTGKRGVVLDLRDTDDKAKLLALLDTTDILVENFKPGSLDRLGLGAERLREDHPSLVYCSINGFGHDSAYPGRPALDTVIQAMSGVMASTLVDGVATKAGISLADQLGGQFGLLAVLAALERRQRTGQGATLDLAMQECAAWATQMCWSSDAASGPAVRVVAAADGYVAVEGDEAALRRALGLAPGFEIDERLAALTREEAVAAIGPAVACACAPVLTTREVLDHPHTRARGLLMERPTPDGGQWTVLASPLRLGATPTLVTAAMPALGFPDPALEAELAGVDAPSQWLTLEGRR